MLTVVTVFSALVLTLIILVPGAAFVRDLDAQRPEERLRPPQSTGEHSRIFCPGCAARDVTAGTLRTQTQKV